MRTNIYIYIYKLKALLQKTIRNYAWNENIRKFCLKTLMALSVLSVFVFGIQFNSYADKTNTNHKIFKFTVDPRYDGYGNVTMQVLFTSSTEAAQWYTRERSNVAWMGVRQGTYILAYGWYVTPNEFYNGGFNNSTEKTATFTVKNRNGANITCTATGKYASSKVNIKNCYMTIIFPHGTSATLKSGGFNPTSSAAGVREGGEKAGVDTMINHVRSCDPSGSWYSNANQHYHYCSTCGYSDDYANHSFSSWQTSGNQHYQKCTVCGYERNRHNIQESAWGLDSNANKHRTYCTYSGCGLWVHSHAITNGAYKYDATNHWRICGNGCGLTVQSATAHNNLSYTFKDGQTHTKKCGTCGYTVTENCTISNGQCTKCGHYFTATLIFNNNGGSGGPGTVTKQIGSTYVPTPDPSRTGYTFKGWAKK